MKTLILIAIAKHEVEHISSPAVLPGGIQLLSVFRDLYRKKLGISNGLN